MIVFSQVTKTFYPDVTAIDNVSFDIDPGEFIFLAGPSGSGKTTIARLLLNEFKPNTGSIQVGEYDLLNMKRNELPSLRRQIGTVFQDFKLFPDRTAYENIALVLEIIDKPDEDIEADVNALLEMTGLADKGHLFPSQLSGGEVQRTAIARALAAEPAVLFADEPTGNLDPRTGWQITQLLKDINSLGTTVIMATHNRDIIKAGKERTIVIDKGKLMSDSKKKSSSPQSDSASKSKPKQSADSATADKSKSAKQTNKK